MKKKGLYFKIIAAMFIAILCTSLLKNEVFLVESPRLRADAGSNLVAFINGLVRSPIRFVANLFRDDKKSPYFQKITTGVYAKDTGYYQEKIYSADAVKWKEYKFEHNGKIFTIRYAEGEVAPDREILKKLVE